MSFRAKAELPHLLVTELVQVCVHLPMFKGVKTGAHCSCTIFLCLPGLVNIENSDFTNLPHVFEVLHCSYSQLKGSILTTRKAKLKELRN